MANEGTVDKDFAIINTGSNLTTNVILVNVHSLEKCFNEKFNSEMGDVVGTVENSIQKAILTAVDRNVTPRIDLTVIIKMRLLSE